MRRFPRNTIVVSEIVTAWRYKVSISPRSHDMSVIENCPFLCRVGQDWNVNCIIATQRHRLHLSLSYIPFVLTRHLAHLQIRSRNDRLIWNSVKPLLLEWQWWFMQKRKCVWGIDVVVEKMEEMKTLKAFPAHFRAFSSQGWNHEFSVGRGEE